MMKVWNDLLRRSLFDPFLQRCVSRSNYTTREQALLDTVLALSEERERLKLAVELKSLQRWEITIRDNDDREFQRPR